jgi:DNA helicase II / ATP-dependent DNA helicase PcrA
MVDLLSSLNSIQRAAVTYGPGPLMILAGAGSGKTKVLTHRIAWLIEQGISPYQILAITFTNKAAGEMKERVRKLLGEGVNLETKDGKLVTNLPLSNSQVSNFSSALPKLGTFHAVCASMLRQHSHHIGIPNNFSIYDETDANALIKQAMKTFDIPVKKINPSAVKSAISGSKNELVSAGEYRGYARGYFQENVARIYPEYQRLLRENQALDFDDLLIETVRLLTEENGVLDYYHEKYQYILIDEYQDTNKIQYLLAKLLAKKNRNINVVGDAAQSIYAFRGADLRNINQFLEDYPEAKVFNLEQNYRSTQKILALATSVIKPNKSAHPVLELWTENGDGDDITVYESADGNDEVNFVVGEIQRYTGPSDWGSLRDKLEKKTVGPTGDKKYSDIAVLYRTNAQSRTFEEGFIRAGIPYQIIGGVRFYERREIKDLVAYLRLINNPKDTVSFERIVNVPPRGIGQVTVKQGGEKLDQFHALMEQLRRRADELSVVDLLDNVIERIKYKNYIHDGSEEGLSRWENVMELRSVAERFSALGGRESLIAFLESISLLEQTDMTQDANARVKVGAGATSFENEGADRVTLMTLHAAKGLEFPLVFLVGMEEGLFPHNRSLEDEFQIQEERRLCYVGVTRARERLYLTYARNRLYFGKFMMNMPSRFLKDVPGSITVYKQTEVVSYMGGDNYAYRQDEYEGDPMNPWEEW